MWLSQMSWLPVLVLTVLGILSIAFMMQMPKEKPVHNVKRVIRGNPEAEVVVVEPVVEPEPVVDVVEPVVEPEPEPVVEPVVEPENNIGTDAKSAFDEIGFNINAPKRSPDVHRYTVAILTTDRRETFGIENRVKKNKNFFQKTYSIVKSVYTDVLVVTDVKTNLYENVGRIEIWQPEQSLEVHMYAKEMYAHALSMENGNGILIFEDDVDLTKQFKTKLDDAINILQGKNIDRFIIECYNTGYKPSRKNIYKDLVQIDYWYGTQCMYFSHSIVKEVHAKLISSKNPYDVAIKNTNIPVFNFKHKSLTQHTGSHQSTGLGGGLHETSLFEDSIGEIILKKSNDKMKGHEKSKIVYLVQGRAKGIKKWSERVKNMGDGAELLYLSYDRDCQDCIFAPQTNYVSGVNMLVRHALKIKDVKFVVQSDFDLDMECKDEGGNVNEKCWIRWNSFLRHQDSEYLISPKTWHDPEGDPTSHATCVEPAVVAVHWDKMYRIFPLPEYNIDKSWWLNIHARWTVAEKCFPNEHFSVSSFRVHNLEHDSKYPKGNDAKDVKEIFEHDYFGLNLDQNYQHRGHRCVVSGKNKLECDNLLKDRFDRWAKEVYSHNETLFLCGHKLDFLSFIYPDRSVKTYSKDQTSTANDVMLNGLFGPPCDIETFKGKIIHINGEAHQIVPENTFGSGGKLFYYVQGILQSIPDGHNLITHRPKNTKKKFMYYANSNCISFRDDAFDKLSTIKHVEAVGACKNNVKGLPRSNWINNWKTLSEYRFGLCMENANAPGYITEKILMAFLAGVVPVYYGTEEVFDIFNRKAFIYYDIKNPEEAITKVKYLEENPDEYEKMLNEPILNDGSYEKYFSKQAITKMLTQS